MKSKDQILLEQTYQKVLESGFGPFPKLPKPVKGTFVETDLVDGGEGVSQYVKTEDGKWVSVNGNDREIVDIRWIVSDPKKIEKLEGILKSGRRTQYSPVGVFERL